MNSLLFALWFFLPAAAANVAPIFAAAIPALRRFDAPMDLGYHWRGQRLLGSHKTWRGFISGMVAATLVLWLQQGLYGHYAWAQTVASGIDYSVLPTFLLGPLLAIGALGGDALESLIKRQRGIAEGQRWVPFDQLDYVVGGLVAGLLVIRLEPAQYALIIVVWFVMHLVSSYLGWRLGLKSAPI